MNNNTLSQRSSRTGTQQFSFELLWAKRSIEAEAREWNSIVEEHYDGYPLISTDWYLTWLKHFSHEFSSINFVKISSGTSVAGYFPLTIKQRLMRGISIFELSFAGNIYSPVTGPVLRPKYAGETISFFFDTVLPQLNWDCFSMLELAKEFPGSAELLECAQRCGWPELIEPGEGNWILGGDFGDPEHYFKSRRYDIRSNVRKFPPKLAELGRLNFRVVTSNLRQKDIDDYRTVYDRSWKEPEKDPEFHPELMRAAADRGRLRLGILSVDDRPIAAQFWLYNRGRGYSVKTAYDEEFKRFAPGTILTWKLFERLMESGELRSVDFLKGDEPYKSTWCNERRERLNVYLFRKSLRGRYLAAVELTFAPLARSIRRRPLSTYWPNI